ncbi:unnamed protein product, partial [Durusdinium trenchii]
NWGNSTVAEPAQEMEWFAMESTAALTAKGNGSCVCHEEHFFGSDEEGRITCVDGVNPVMQVRSLLKAVLARSAALEPLVLQPAGSATCSACPAGKFSTGATCKNCEILALDVVLALIAWIAAACLCFLCLTGFAYGIPVADVSAQGAKLVVTTSLAHFLLTWARPEVTFSGTGVPDLDSKRFSVKPLSSFQLTLSASESSLDTSMGHLHVKSLRGFLVMGFWRCPLIGWCILFLGVFSASISQISWSLTLVVSSLGMCTGALAFALRRRWGCTL